MLSALHSAHRASLLREKRQTKALQDIGSKRLIVCVRMLLQRALGTCREGGRVCF